MVLMTQDKLITKVLGDSDVSLTLRLTGVYPVSDIAGVWVEYATCIDLGYVLEVKYPGDDRATLLVVPADRLGDVMVEISRRQKKAPQMQG